MYEKKCHAHCETCKCILWVLPPVIRLQKFSEATCWCCSALQKCGKKATNFETHVSYLSFNKRFREYMWKIHLFGGHKVKPSLKLPPSPLLAKNVDEKMQWKYFMSKTKICFAMLFYFIIVCEYCYNKCTFLITSYCFPENFFPDFLSC